MKKTTGDCYEAAVAAMMDLRRDGTETIGELVHGVVTGEGGEVAGTRYGHAWIEIGDVVFDRSNGREIAIRREVYYERGEIDPDECKRYNFKRMGDELFQAGHYGPWAEGLSPERSGNVSDPEA